MDGMAMSVHEMGCCAFGAQAVPVVEAKAAQSKREWAAPFRPRSWASFALAGEVENNRRPCAGRLSASASGSKLTLETLSRS